MTGGEAFREAMEAPHRSIRTHQASGLTPHQARSMTESDRPMPANPPPPSPESPRASLSDADDRIRLNHWMPPQQGIFPRIRIGRRWSAGVSRGRKPPAAHTGRLRNNMPRIGRALIAQGRDAADVPITHTFGPNTLVSFEVWTDEVS